MQSFSEGACPGANFPLATKHLLQRAIKNFALRLKTKTHSWALSKKSITAATMWQAKGKKGVNTRRKFHAWRVCRMAPVFSLFTHTNEQYADEQTWAGPRLHARCTKLGKMLVPLNSWVSNGFFLLCDSSALYYSINGFVAHNCKRTISFPGSVALNSLWINKSLPCVAGAVWNAIVETEKRVKMRIKRWTNGRLSRWEVWLDWSWRRLNG